MWGVRLGDPSGRYQVTAISPARLGTVVNASTWQYAGSGSTSEVIAVVRLASLTAALSRTGAPATGHFEIALIGDPRKQKTFWISCAPVIGTSPPPRTPPVSPPAAPPTPAVPSSGVTVGSGSTSSVAPRAGATVVGGVLGLTTTPDTGTLLPLGLGALLALLGGATLTARRFFPGGRR